MEQLGRFVRSSYFANPEASPPLSPDAVSVVSTNTSRTVLSARGFLRGLLPELDEEGIMRKIEVPYLIPEEPLIPNYQACDRLRRDFHDTRRLVAGEELLQKTCKQWVQAVGSWPQSLIQAGDPLRSLSGHGLPRPQGISASLEDAVNHCGHRLIDAYQGSDDSLTLLLSSGRLVHVLAEGIEAAAAGKIPWRVSVVSAHDTSVGSLLLALGLPTTRWPDFASSVWLELLRSSTSGEWCVRVAFFDGPPGPGNLAPAAERVWLLGDWRLLAQRGALDEAAYGVLCALPPGEPDPPFAKL